MSILRVNICLSKHGPGTTTVVTKHVYRPLETDTEWGWDAYLHLKELPLRHAVQGPLRKRWTFLLMLYSSLLQQPILPKNWPLGPELMITQHILLMEMLFLGSMLMIIIVTNLAWEPVSQHLNPWLHSNSISCPEKVPRTGSPWLILCQTHLRMYTLGRVCWNSYKLEAFFLSILSS